jgi:hypothetical protein
VLFGNFWHIVYLASINKYHQVIEEERLTIGFVVPRRVFIKKEAIQND